MKEGVVYNISDILEGRQAPPVMPGPNPHPLWTVEWYAWKEEHENYVPYHVGSGCQRMPRVREVRPGVYRCPACGVEFPTARARLAAQEESP